MKKTFLSIIALIITANAFAQWTTGTNISNTNTGNVGIGTASPSTILHVNAPAVASTLEQIIKGTTADGGANAFFFSNGTTITLRFYPK